MSELVLLHHNEPMTTSLAIADGVQMEHSSILKLIRNHLESLASFGRVGFEIQPFDTAGGKQWRDVYFLNEPQSTLLITFMRNSEIVIAFKIALVKAFFELRDRVKASAPTFTTTNLSHGADLAVAADRTFRGFIRAARKAGMGMPQALQVANRQTIARTGMDMLHELGVEAVDEAADTSKPQDSTSRFVSAWLGGETRYPCTMCRNADLLAAYRQWCADKELRPMTDLDFHRRIGKHPELEKTQSHIGKETLRVVMPAELEQPYDETKSDWTARCLAEFRASLN